MWLDKIHITLVSPITSLLITLIIAAIAFSGRLSVIFSNIFLILAFLIGGFGIFRIEQKIYLRIIMCLILGIGLSLISWWIKPKELFSQNFPGMSLHSLIKINDISEKRRKYLFDLGKVDGSRFSVYISADNIFTFSFIDASGEQHNIQLPIGSSGIPYGIPCYLICEIGIDGQSTLLRMLVNGKEIKSIQLPFKIDLGGIDIPGGVVGADLNGKNGASFDMGNLMVFGLTMISSQITALTKTTLDYYESSNRHFMTFNGKQWMRAKKNGFRDFVQDDQLLKPIWK